MNRPLKFRAYDTIKKEWINESNEFPFSIIGETTIFEILRHYSIKDYLRIEIQQYTGLEDAKGKMIFEGDIVKYWGGTALIEYNIFGFAIKYNDDEFFDINEPEKLEIIGNIYETNVRHT